MYIFLKKRKILTESLLIIITNKIIIKVIQNKESIMKKSVLIILVIFNIALNVLAVDVKSKPSENPIPFKSLESSIELAKVKPTVLFFKADWCPTCIAAAKDFEKNRELLKDVNLVVVNYDKSRDLQKKYGVTYQHTFVQISTKGDALVKWNGGSTDKLLKSIIRETR